MRSLHSVPVITRQVPGSFRGLASCCNPLLRSFQDGFGGGLYVDTPHIH